MDYKGSAETQRVHRDTESTQQHRESSTETHTETERAEERRPFLAFVNKPHNTHSRAQQATKRRPSRGPAGKKDVEFCFLFSRYRRLILLPPRQFHIIPLRSSKYFLSGPIGE